MLLLRDVILFILCFMKSDWQDKERLHVAAAEGDLNEAKTLIQEGVSLHAFDDLSYTPLHYAVINGDLDMTRLLLKAGANVNACQVEKIGNTPLREVAGNCSLEMAKLLVDAGADPTIQGWMQLTALHVATQRKRPEGKRVLALLRETSKLDRSF